MTIARRLSAVQAAALRRRAGGRGVQRLRGAGPEGPRRSARSPGEPGAAARPGEHLRGGGLRALRRASWQLPGDPQRLPPLRPDHLGSEPHAAEALAQPAWGAAPSSPSTASTRSGGRRGRRAQYVHIPVRYGGITEDQVMQIAKSFRELGRRSTSTNTAATAAPPPQRSAAWPSTASSATSPSPRCGSGAARRRSTRLYSTVATATIPSQNRPRLRLRLLPGASRLRHARGDDRHDPGLGRGEAGGGERRRPDEAPGRDRSARRRSSPSCCVTATTPSGPTAPARTSRR